MTHRIDPATHKSKKAPKMTDEEKTRKQAAEQAKGEQINGRKRKSHDKFDPPQVKEHSEAFRMKKGQRRRSNGPRNFNLKAMRTVTTEVKCDPKQLERIRQKQKTPHTTKEFEDRMPASVVINECQVSEVSAVELDDGYRSTRSSAAMAQS